MKKVRGVAMVMRGRTIQELLTSHRHLVAATLSAALTYLALAGIEG